MMIVQVSLAAFKLELEGFTSIKRRLEDPEFMTVPIKRIMRVIMKTGK